MDRLTAIGVSANAYTTNDHTAYLYECTEHFYEALDEFMDYVQHPYFTDENVEKEKGIIGQEIRMYDDYPDWRVYLNALEAMYHTNPIKLDAAGTIESISHIDKEILYKCYNTFYNPSNMCLVVGGDFESENILEEIKRRLVDKKQNGEIKRIIESEEESIVKESIEQKFNVSRPLFTVGIKCKLPEKSEAVKINITMQIILEVLFGESSDLFQQMYKEGNMFSAPSLSYEFGDNYAHILISENASNPQEVYSKLKEKIKELKTEGIKLEDFTRTKKMIYGGYIKEFNDVSEICRLFLSDFMKGVNSFDYFDEIDNVDLNYANKILKENFDENKMVLSVVY